MGSKKKGRGLTFDLKGTRFSEQETYGGHLEVGNTGTFEEPTHPPRIDFAARCRMDVSMSCFPLSVGHRRGGRGVKGTHPNC